jgi:RNA polymerase sigma-70 factor (ECF subfamily)
VHTGDPPDADDLTQDVLVQMLQKLDSFQPDGRFTTWLYAVTRNAAEDRFRRIRMGDSLAADPRAYLALVPEPDGDPAGAAERAGLRGLLDVLFQELPWRQREVFDLVELQGFDAAHVAELLDIEPVTVRAHLFKARRGPRPAARASAWPPSALLRPVRGRGAPDLGRNRGAPDLGRNRGARRGPEPRRLDAIDAPSGEYVAVIATDNPDITVLWFFEGGSR